MEFRQLYVGCSTAVWLGYSSSVNSFYSCTSLLNPFKIHFQWLNINEYLALSPEPEQCVFGALQVGVRYYVVTLRARFQSPKEEIWKP